MKTLTQAGLWILGLAVAMGGFGVTAMAMIDAGQALRGESGYGQMTQGEMTAYGISTVGAALLIAAMTVGALVGLWAFWRYLKTEVFWK